MKIVVDIPRKYYEDFKLQLPILNRGVPSELAKYVVATGTPLPKGHGDLIDRNEAEKIADKMFEHITSPLLNHIQTYDAYNIIRLTPTIIEADKTEDFDNLDSMLEDLWNDYDKAVEE